MRVTAAVHREGGRFVSWCPELDVASQGASVEEALSNLREAIEFHLEDQDLSLPEEPFLVTTVEVGRAGPARPPEP